MFALLIILPECFVDPPWVMQDVVYVSMILH
jgi:hypothetical protein